MSQDYLPIEKPGLLPANEGEQLTSVSGSKSWVYVADTTRSADGTRSHSNVVPITKVGRWVLVFDQSGSGGGGGGGTPTTGYEFRDGEGVRASTGSKPPVGETPVVHNLDIDKLEDLS